MRRGDLVLDVKRFRLLLALVTSALAMADGLVFLRSRRDYLLEQIAGLDQKLACPRPDVKGWDDEPSRPSFVGKAALEDSQGVGAEGHYILGLFATEFASTPVDKMMASYDTQECEEPFGNGLVDAWREKETGCCPRSGSSYDSSSIRCHLMHQVNLFSPAQLRLGTILRLHEALGSPANALPAIHVAGTNGKGSVTFKMAKSLELGGVKTGLFVSPHVSCFRERMQVNGELIPEATVERLLPEIFEICETENLPATFFEITTALAFQHFRKSGVETMILETGLGGRLVATNIVTPAVSIITSIGILGNTVEEIAMEKSGIFKAGVPALVGEGCPFNLLKSVADALGSPFHRWLDVLMMPTNARDGPPAEEGKDFDDENTRLAEAGLRLLWRSHPDLRVEEVALREGLAQRPPCRFETVKVYADVDNQGARARASRAIDVGRQEGIVTVVLDVAHNLPAIKALFAKVTREFPGRRVRVVASFSKDKEITKCLTIMLRHSGPDRIHFAEASARRATPLATLVSTLKEPTGGKVDASGRARAGDDSERQALRDAIHEAAVSGEGGETSEKDVVLVCGSLYMMADARQELGFEKPQEILQRLGTDD